MQENAARGILFCVEITVKSLIGRPLMHDGAGLGRVRDVRFFSETGKFAGVRSETGKCYPADAVVVEAGGIRITRNEPQKCMGEDWLGYRAQSAKGDKLGIIDDISFDPDLQIMTRLTVLQSLLFVPLHKRTFGYERIIDVRKRTVVFNCDTTIGEKIPAAISGNGMDMPASQRKCYQPARELETQGR